MREEWARWVTFLSGLVILVLALAFAWAHNRAPTEAPAPAPKTGVPLSALDAGLVARGRDVYQANGCAACHAVQGVGHPRNPLDGVGQRLNPEQLRDWTVGAGHLEEALPPNDFRRKQRYQELSEDELAALVAYLQSL